MYNRNVKKEESFDPILWIAKTDLKNRNVMIMLVFCLKKQFIHLKNINIY